MKTFFLLTKINLINNYNLHSLNPKNIMKQKSKWRSLIIPLVLISLIPTYYLYIRFLKAVSFSLMTINQESYFLFMGHSSLSLMIFFFGIFHIISSYYFSKDTDFLLTLPINNRIFILSKFTNILFFEYLILTIFFIPILIINKSIINAGFLYYINSLILFILTPVIPLGIVSIIVIPVMRITNIKGKKDLFRSLSMILTIIFIFGIQILIQRGLKDILPGSESEYIAKLFADNKYLIDTLGRYYPLSKISVNFVNNTNYVSFLILATALLVVIYLVILVSEKLYLGGLLGGDEATSEKKVITEEDLDKRFKSTSAWFGIFKTDIKVLLKTPIFMFNCISTAIIIPFVFFVMPLLTGVMDSDLAYIEKAYSQNVEYFTLGTVGALILFTAMNPTGSTAFSRDGETFWILRVIPVRSKDIILGKGVSPFLIQLVTAILIVLSLNFYFPVTPVNMLFMLMNGIIFSVPVIFLQLYIDISRPMLKWDNPQNAVKQNMNVLSSMVLGAVYVGIIGVISYLMIQNNISSVFIYLSAYAYFLGTSYLFYKILVCKIHRQLIEIE